MIETISTELNLFGHEKVQTSFAIYMGRNKIHCIKYVLNSLIHIIHVWMTS